MYFRFILQRGSTRWKGDSNPRSPLREDAFGTATLPGWDRLEPHLLPRGTEGSNPLSSTSESLSAVIFAIPGTARAGRASCSKFAKLLEQEAGVVDPVPALLGGLDRTADFNDPDIVVQHVDTAECCDASINYGSDVSSERYVSGNRLADAAFTLDDPFGLVPAVHIAYIGMWPGAAWSRTA